IGAVLRRFTPVVEQASSDEFYLDLSGTEQLYGGAPLAATARRMRDAVMAEPPLSLSIGGATSKPVTTLASGCANPRLGGRADGRAETCATDLDDDAVLAARLLSLADRASADVREAGLVARTVTVKLRDADFTTRQASRTLADAVQSDRAVYAVARELLTRLRAARRVPARLLGVALSQLVRTDGEGQLSL